MKKLAIILSKTLLHILCLMPVAFLALAFLIGNGILTIHVPGVHPDLGADPVRTITLNTGYVTLLMLLLSLCITPLRRIPRMSWLIRYRRMLGLYAFFYGTLHMITYFWLANSFNLRNIIADVIKHPYVTAGMTAWLSMLPLALTSTTWSIRKLGKNWQRLHRLAYLSAIAGVVHYWWLVKQGNLEPLRFTILLAVLLLARIFWSYRQKRKAAAANQA